MRSLFEPDVVRELRPLRGRQIPLIPQITQAVKEGHKRILIQAACGFGKTVVAAHLMDRSAQKGRRPMFVAPAIALVEQTLHSFESQGIQDIGIIQAQHYRTDFKAQIQIASRDTLVRRPLPEVDFAIIDEAHDQRESLNAILDGEEWKDKIVIGLSATPWSKGLGLHWTKLIVAATMADMIADGYPTGLVPFRVFSAAVDPDTSRLKIVAGEFQESGAAALMSDPRIIGDAVDTWMRHRQEQNHPGDRTFLYGQNRAHAKSLMEAFRAKDISCGYIDGESSPEDRLRSFKRYRSREDKLMANVGVLLVGVDEDVRCMVDCALTRSEITHVQKCGRAARLGEEKPYALLLDHAGNCVRLGMPWDIHHDHLDDRTPKEKGEAYQDEKPTPKPRKCGNCRAVIPPKTRSCPSCGDVYSAPNTVEHESGELVEIRYDGRKNKSKKSEKPTKDIKQEFYSGLLMIAQQRGYKDGWVQNKYREKFGVWMQGLDRIAKTPSKQVRDWETSRRIAWAKSKNKPQMSQNTGV